MPKERYQDPARLLRKTKAGVWYIRPWVDIVSKEGRVIRAKRTTSFGSIGKREALQQAKDAMSLVNRAQYVVTSQIRLNNFLQEYNTLHVDSLSFSTQLKYRAHLENHITPAFGKLALCEITSLLVKQWLDAKREKLSWATLTDLRNLMSSIFSKAIEWDRWKDVNPIERVHVGRKAAKWEHRKLTDDETRRLLAALPEDVRLLCCVCLFGTLRISEALGLQEKHLDFDRGLILIRQRFYRGDLDVPKNAAARRDIPMGYLADALRKITAGDPNRFVFQIRTRPDWGRKITICRDDRDLNQHFLRPAAKMLGIYRLGFGFHAFRREAVTWLGMSMNAGQVMQMSGHSSLGMMVHYTLSDLEKQSDAIRARQEHLIGRSGGKIQ